LPVTPDEFRDALARWASGVTIVTSRLGDRVHGMTVSAFSSVSLDPPLVLVCADKASNTCAFIAESGVFAVSILASGQDDLSRRFAATQDEERRFEGVAVESAVTGSPLLPGLASLDCTLVGTHDAGDHRIYVGRVEAVRRFGDGEPLLYYRGAYRTLG
jgi:flavin reductase (DIM6/NTAB) family NADH-FMN oxidoreductase RutF